MANKESGPGPGLERRKAKRFICTMDIFTEISFGRDDEYLRAGGSGYLTIPGPEKQRARVIDLSRSGAKLLAKSPIKVGTPVAIRLETSPRASPIEGKAKVVWWKKTKSESTAYYVGIVFQDLGWWKRFRIKRLIKRLSAGP